MKIRRIRLTIGGIAAIILIVVAALLITGQNRLDTDDHKVDTEHLENAISTGNLVEEYEFMGGKCRVYEDDSQGYIAAAIFDIDMSDWMDVDVLYGEQTYSSAEYYKLYGEETGGLVWSAEAGAYVDEFGQLYMTVSAPIYIEGAYILSIEGKDTFAWTMNEEQYLALAEDGGVSFEYEGGRMGIAFEIFR